jgi:hypothetical protein
VLQLQQELENLVVDHHGVVQLIGRKLLRITLLTHLDIEVRDYIN